MRQDKEDGVEEVEDGKEEEIGCSQIKSLDFMLGYAMPGQARLGYAKRLSWQKEDQADSKDRKKNRKIE